MGAVAARLHIDSVLRSFSTDNAGWETMSLRKHWVVLLLAAVAGCMQEDGPVGLGQKGDETTSSGVPALACRADLGELRLDCVAPGAAAGGGGSGALIGGQGVYVILESENVSYDEETKVFSAEVAIRNLLTQTLGTADGVNADPDGIRIFFVNAPLVTAGSGTVAVRSADGTGEFTGAGQPYYQYDVMLAPWETSSPRTWEWDVPETVEAFTFLVGVSARVADEDAVVPGLTLVPQSVAAGQSHSCALTPTGEAYCWGSNANGQLGDGTTTDRSRPVRVNTELRFVALAAGFQHTCGLTAEGAAYCWGAGGQGRLGNGTDSRQTTPVPVLGGHRFVTISASSSNTCAVAIDGTGYCWGYGLTGRNGDGTFQHRMTPVEVQGGHKFRTISAAHYHTCGVTTSGQAYCWGDNAYARRGDGTVGGAQIATPVPVAGGLEFVTVAGGEYHSCALTASGAAYCWGINGAYGRIGNGSTNDTLRQPTAVAGGQSFVAIGAGEYHTCALATTGEVYCWGRDNDGQAGNGATTGNVLTPKPVAGGRTFAALAVGLNHACAITAEGEVYCWGQGTSGQIGDGSTGANQPTFVELVERPSGPGGVAEQYGSYTLERYYDPDRTLVKDGAGNWLATYTRGSYTVLLRGPSRTYVEGGRTLVSDEWVRVLPTTFYGTVDTLELAAMLQDTTPDIIALSMQYIAGAPPIYDGTGRQIAGDAGYGDGIGADFNDYLGIKWTYPSGTTSSADAKFFRKLDCSGFVRMVFGYRGTPHKVPLSLTVKYTTLPRTSYNQYDYGTGVILIRNREAQVPANELSVLQPGDLLFFDSSSSRNTPNGINHVGIYLGRDTAGRMRFISSLPSADGPVFGRSSGNDFVIDGTGFWARALRGARRL